MARTGPGATSQSVHDILRSHQFASATGHERLRRGIPSVWMLSCRSEPYGSYSWCPDSASSSGTDAETSLVDAIFARHHRHVEFGDT
jgi:hypothetical protein